MQKEQLLDIIKIAPKPPSMWELEADKNNGFRGYIPEIEKLPEELKPLIILSQEITQKAHEANTGYRARMNPVVVFENGHGTFYLSGGILFRDEETLHRLGRYFDIEVTETPKFDTWPNHGGLESVLRMKDLGKSMQFVARGGEWATSAGYAHMCMGQISYDILVEEAKKILKDAEPSLMLQQAVRIAGGR